MTRSLKKLATAVLALAALSIVAPSGAQAENPHFISPFEGGIKLTSTLDDEGGANPKTGHGVFDIRKADGTGTRSVTCSGGSGETHVTGPTATQVTLEIGLQGDCQFLGQSVTIDFGACDALVTADGTIHIQTKLGSGEKEGCRHGERPATMAAFGCHVEVGEQTASGVKFHNIEAGGVKMVTIEATNISGIVYNASGANCPYGTTSNGLATTGNVIVTGAETNNPTNMVNIEWKTGA